jgi:hypothetical protein
VEDETSGYTGSFRELLDRERLQGLVRECGDPERNQLGTALLRSKS